MRKQKFYFKKFCKCGRLFRPMTKYQYICIKCKKKKALGLPLQVRNMYLAEFKISNNFLKRVNT